MADLVSKRELNRATLARQGLLERESTAPIRLAERLCGLQAQELLPPLIGLWTRLDGVDREGLERLVADGKLVRATLMRGTLHLVTAADYRRLRPAMQPVLDDALRAHAYTRGMDAEPVVEAARKLLAKGPMTFAELRPKLAKAFPDLHERGMGYAVRLRTPLVVSPDGGFELAETGRAISRAKLIERYLTAFGPATPADMQAWCGLKGLADDFAPAELKQHGKLFDVPGAPRPDPETPAPVRFLPAFDNLVLAHKDRTRVLASEHQARVTTKNLRVNPTFLVDGFVAGVWKHERKGKAATLRLEPFGRLTKKVRAELEREGEALLRFLEPDASAFAVI